MIWTLSHHRDPAVVPLADRHYSRKTKGAAQFTPPGRKLVLKHEDDEGAVDAYWVTSYPFKEYVRHAWAGALLCSAFRNESKLLSSDMIRDALAATRDKYRLPSLGMVTFIDTRRVRRKRDPGRCFRKAGFEPAGFTQGGLVVLQLTPEGFPGPVAPMRRQLDLFVDLLSDV